MKISLCLMTLNELGGCQLDVPKLPRDAFDEIYCVDGGSSDGTVDYLNSCGIKVYKHPKKGLNAAYVHANEVSNCDAVVVFFPKGTTPIEDLTKFRPLLEDGYELIVASRQIEGSVNDEDIHWWRPRKVAVWFLAFVSMFIWRREGYWIRDVLHGHKAFTKGTFNKMKILEHGLSIDIEMVVRSYKLRIRRCEFPTKETARLSGATHFKIWPTGKKLLSYLWF
jgi:glycosyltransferase involved in cell wall biosynthesis